MGEWKPGTLLVGPSGSRGIVLESSGNGWWVWRLIHADRLLIEEGTAHSAAWTVVDEWPDPKDEARERLLDEIRVAWGGGRSSVGVLDALLARPDDLRLLLGDE